MDKPRLRPTFTVPLPMSPDEAVQRLRARLEASGEGDCQSAGRCAEFFVDEKDRRIWSPYLSIQVEEENPGSVLRGRFAPHPEVWTFFMFVYFAVAFLLVLGSIWGFVQWTLGESPWGLWAIPVGVPVLAGLHGISALGQRWGADQMDGLRGRLDRLLEGL